MLTGVFPLHAPGPGEERPLIFVPVWGACSDIKLPSDGQLHMWAPAAAAQGQQRRCEGNCMRLGAFDVPRSHKLTTPLFAGAPQGALQRMGIDCRPGMLWLCMHPL
jgi:hypothetical protein